MANLSELTRKEQVEKVLRDHLGLWVDGTALSNEQVGGSEGLKRVRELRRELRAGGRFAIQERPHPDAGRSVHQYRMVEQTTAFTPSGEPSWTAPRQEVPHARFDPPAAAPRSSPAPQPSQSTWVDPLVAKADTEWHHWKPAKKARGTLEYVFWIGKQRVIGAIGPLGDNRWGWGVLVPANKARLTRERRAGHGVAPDKNGAREAVERCVREMRESGEYR